MSNENAVDVVVAKLAPKMELPTVTVRKPIVNKSTRGFVLDEPLKEETFVSFIGKRSMGKTSTQGFTVKCDLKPDGSEKQSTDCDVVTAPKAAIVQVPGIPVNNVVKATVVSSNEDILNSPGINVPVKDEPVVLPNVVNINKSISKVSNLIKDYLASQGIYAKVKDDIRDKKIFEGTFLTKVQNAIYHSLREFCGVVKGDDNVDILPAVNIDTDELPTLMFFDRIFNDKSISFEKDPTKVMSKYREIFQDCDGIQDGWVEKFKARIKLKCQFDDRVIDTVVSSIIEEWGITELPVMVVDASIVTQSGDIVPERLGDAETRAKFSVSNEVTSSVKEMLWNSQEAEENSECDEADEEGEYLTVDIIKDGDSDIIKIDSPDRYGKVSIPFYTNIDSIATGDHIPSMADERNGIWDWLIHFMPMMMFRTNDPEKYLAINDDNPSDTKIKCVIMDEANGMYVIGIYCVDSITRYDSNGDGTEDFSDDTIGKVNQIVNIEIASGYISNLSHSLDSDDLFRDEKFILNYVMGCTENGNNECCNDECCAPEHHHAHVVNQTHDEDNGAHVEPEDLASEASLAALKSMGIGVNAVEEESVLPMDVNHEEVSPVIDIPTAAVDAKETDTRSDEEFTFQPIQKKPKLQD